MTEWFKQQEIISHSSGGWRPKIKVLADSVPQRRPFSWLEDCAFLLYPHMAGKEGALVSLPLLIRTLIQLWEVGSHLYDLI